MNLLKKGLQHPNLILVLSPILIGIGLLVTLGFRSSAKEITYPELEQLMHSKRMNDTRVEPTPYSGIYRIEGTYEGLAGTRGYLITTRLDEGQAKAPFTMSATKVILSGQGARGQLVNMI